MFGKKHNKATKNSNKTVDIRSRRNRKQKASDNKKNVPKNFGKKCTKLALSMSTWAENFTVATTWQLKHQIAYWKAKVKSLEYENRILHDIIRQKYFNDISESHSDDDPSHTTEVEDENEVNPEEHDLEVSEEFIRFLTENAKYKEEARREKERLKKRNRNDREKLSISEEGDAEETLEEKQKILEELYGSHWQQIGALEIASQSQFLHDCDKYNPQYWPNIPFNFNN